jgi:imidazolonepropionase
MSSLAVLHASQLVTLSGPKRPRVGREFSDLGIIRDGGMLIHDGKIESVGPTDGIQKDVRDAEVVDAGGRVVMPGFVDAHTHLVFAGDRLDDFERRARGETYEQIAKAGGGIWSTVQKTRAASELDLLTRAKKHANWLLRCGTTTAEVKSGYGLTVEDELKILRVMRQLKEQVRLKIVSTFLGAHAVPRELSPDEYLEVVVTEMLPRVSAAISTLIGRAKSYPQQKSSN